MDKILAAAKNIAKARRSRAPLAALAADIAPRDEADGYKVQRALHDLMLPQTGALVGYKIGCTSRGDAAISRHPPSLRRRRVRKGRA